VRALSRLVIVLGAVGVGLFLFSRSPRDVVLEYDVGAVPEAIRLEVDVRRGGDLVRHAEFRLPGRGESIVRHALSIPRGEYVLAWRLVTPDGSVTGERPIVVEEEGTIVLALGG
jgi:methionine-rich copper-binding protein CopC